MTKLWTTSAAEPWREALEHYPDAVASMGSERLTSLDRWYREELPGAIAARQRPHVTLPELVRLTEWKMARGVWRGPNLARVRSNDPNDVVALSADALDHIPHERQPIAGLMKLDGVGPATASAVVAAVAPARYPFLDDDVAAQIPGLGPVAWTLAYYVRYAEALRQRANILGGEWTPVMVERALWSDHGPGCHPNR
jgi:hypothetical protein